MYICKHVRAYLLRNIYLDVVCFEFFLESGCIFFFFEHFCWRHTDIFSCLKHSKFSYVQIVSKDSFTFWTKFEFSW